MTARVDLPFLGAALVAGGLVWQWCPSIPGVLVGAYLLGVVLMACGKERRR